MDVNVQNNLSAIKECRLLHTDKPWNQAPVRFATEYVRGSKKDRDYTLPEFYVGGRPFREQFQDPRYILQHANSRVIRPEVIPRIRGNISKPAAQPLQ